MKLWLTADPHFGCEKLIENTRPEFSDTKQHDEHLIDQYNMCAKPNDMLVIIGDWCKDKPGRYRQQLRCKNIHFILGNHDKEAKIKRVFGGNVWTQRMIKAGDKRILCAHHPQCYWDRSHYGVFHAYGHLHNNKEREAAMDRGFPGRRSMDVGVDSHKAFMGTYRPWSADMFFAWLGCRQGHDIIKREDRWNIKDFKTGDDA